MATESPARLPLSVVRPFAIALYNEMLPFCDRLRVAGSIRRNRDDVKDIDLVCIPRMTTRAKQDSLFGEEIPVNTLYEEWAEKQHRVRWIKPGESKIIDWAVEPAGKQWRGYLDDPVCTVDIFISTPEQFGLTHFIRTGSVEWNAAVMVHARRIGCRVEDNWLWRRVPNEVGWQRIVTRTESDVFAALGMAYIEPTHRNGPNDIWPAGRATPSTAGGEQRPRSETEFRAG